MQEHSFFPRPNHACRLAARPSLLAAIALGSCVVVRAQASAPIAPQVATALPDAPLPQSAGPRPQPETDEVTLRNTPRNFLHDQGMIWSSPARIRTRDLKWLVPLSAATGVAFATGHYTMTQVVSHNPGFNNASVNTSNVLIGSWIAAPVVIYGYGHFQPDDHAREAGILTSESMLDGVVVEEVLKEIFRRERPYVDDARGHFFQSNVGADSSFPSSHSLIAWSAASALAAEYSSHWTQFALYSAATSVSLTRVLGQEHFPSDVLVGGALGWLIGHNVVRRHHHHQSLSESGMHR